MAINAKRKNSVLLDFIADCGAFPLLLLFGRRRYRGQVSNRVGFDVCTRAALGPGKDTDCRPMRMCKLMIVKATRVLLGG